MQGKTFWIHILGNIAYTQNIIYQYIRANLKCYCILNSYYSNSIFIKCLQISFNGIEILFDDIINTIVLSMNETNNLLRYVHSLIECKGIMITENNITR